MTPSELVAVTIATAAFLGALAIVWKFMKRGRLAAKNVIGDVVATRDSIIGRPAVLDSITGEVLAPALLGVGARMAHQEQQTEILTVAVTKLVDQQTAIAEVKAEVAVLREDVDELKAARMERIITRAESTQAWSTMESAIKATPDESE